MSKRVTRLAAGIALAVMILSAGCANKTEVPVEETLAVETSEPVLTESPAEEIAPTGAPVPTATTSAPQEYIDPEGQYRFDIPAGWDTLEEANTFSGPDGIVQTGYLPEMAFMSSVNRVCESLANPPEGPARKIDLAAMPNAEACLLVPLPEQSMDRVRLVVENILGEPEQRYFYIDVNKGSYDLIVSTLELLNPPTQWEEFPYPTGNLRAEDEDFWEREQTTPDGLTVEEVAVVADTVDSPTHLEFNDRIPPEVLQKREPWRLFDPQEKIADNNALLEPFGYSLKPVEGAEMELYELYHGEELVLGEISEVWKASVSGSGSDFALVVMTTNGGAKLVRNDALEDWDSGANLSFPPVFHGDTLLTVRWGQERGQVQVLQDGEPFYAFASLFLVDMPVKGLWSWDGHWLLEVDGFLIQDGENLNRTLGYEEIFGWQLIDGKPFYYFRKGPQVGITYDGQVLPGTFDEIVHYRCCEYGAFNPGGNEVMAWFYGLREGLWYYVEVGVYGE